MPVQTVTALFENSGDTDWFRVHLVAGQSYQMNISSSYQGVMMKVMQPDGQEMHFPIAFGNLADFVAPVTGDFFVAGHRVGGSLDPVLYSITVEDYADAFPAWTGTSAALAVGETRTVVSNFSFPSFNNDWFAIDLVAGQSYVLSTESIAGKVYVADAGGAVVAIEGFGSGGQQAHFTATETGRYYAGAQHSSGSTYKLTLLAVADDHGDTPAGAGSLAVGAAVNGRWESGGDDDAYAITLAAGASYNFSVSSVGAVSFSDYIRILDEAGNQVWTSYGQPSAAATIFSPASDGTYYVIAGLNSIATHPDNPNTYLAGWDYTLNAVTVAGDLTDNPLTTGALTVGAAPTAGIWETQGDRDWLEVELVAGQTYLFDLSTPNWDGVGLTLFDDQGNELNVVNGFSPSPSGTRLAHTALATGSYFISALVGKQAGSYTISVAPVADDFSNNTATTGHLVANGAAASGVSENVADTDWFSIELTAGLTYKLVQGAANVGLAVRDAEGKLVSEPYAYDISFTPSSSGTYFVEAGGANGAYTFTVQTVSDDYLESAGTTGVIRTQIGGTGGADTFVSTEAYEYFVGGGGDDLFVASTGYDLFEGGAGSDTVSYAGLARASTVDLRFGRSEIDGAFRDMVRVENVVGTAFDDVIIGSSVANFIDGGSGADRMQGFGGNDIYIVDNGGDVVVEAAGGGRDVVYARASYTLNAGAEIEVLSVISQGAGTVIDLTGNELGQELYGNTESNFLDGGGGADYMAGFGGSDIYVVDQGGDVIAESAGGGRDVVYARASYTLNAGAEVEVLSVISQGGGTIIDLTGNELGHEPYGNTESNFLDGGGGADYLQGFGGNDNYVVETQGDVVIEGAGEGNHDVVYARSSYALGAGQQIEVLSAQSQGATAALDLTGNEFGNELYGNEGANVLNGGAGSDYLFGYGGADTLDGGAGADFLVGYAGADSFAFTSAVGNGNLGNIAGFEMGVDKIVLDHAVFAGLALGTLSAGAFVTGNPQDADDRIIFNQGSGILLYDADGNGAGAAVAFASVLQNTQLTANDFIVI